MNSYNADNITVTAPTSAAMAHTLRLPIDNTAAFFPPKMLEAVEEAAEARDDPSDDKVPDKPVGTFDVWVVKLVKLDGILFEPWEEVVPVVPLEFESPNPPLSDVVVGVELTDAGVELVLLVVGAEDEAFVELVAFVLLELALPPPPDPPSQQAGVPSGSVQHVSPAGQQPPSEHECAVASAH